MALEQLFKITYTKKHHHAFYLGFFSSLIGLISAMFIFPANVDLMSVAFISILLIPLLTSLIGEEIKIELREKRLSLGLIFKDHKDIFKVYIFAFLGIFVAYSLMSLVFPETVISRLFFAQLNSAGVYGFPITQNPFGKLILNNTLVLLICFVLSLIYGAGSILFLTWNASVWGVVFTFFIVKSYDISGQNPLLDAGKLILPFLPHLITEAIAYISAAIVGGVVSKAVLQKKLLTSNNFRIILDDALVLLSMSFILIIIAAFVEINVYKFM